MYCHVKLKKWREQEIDQNKHCHQRKLERIDQNYVKTLKQIFEDSVELIGIVRKIVTTKTTTKTTAGFLMTLST